MVYMEIYRVRQKYYYSTTIYFLRQATSLVLNTHNNITEKKQETMKMDFSLGLPAPGLSPGYFPTLDVSPLTLFHSSLQ